MSPAPSPLGNLARAVVVVGWGGSLVFTVFTTIGSPGLTVVLLVLIVILGVSMARFVVPVGRDEAVLVWGRLFGPTTVSTGDRVGRATVPPGAKWAKLSLRVQPVALQVDCQSADFVPVTIKLKGAFCIHRTEDAILRAFDRFGDDQKQMRRLVAETLAGHVRDMAGQTSAKEATRVAGMIAGEALNRAGRYMAYLGLEPVSLTIEDVVLPPAWVDERKKALALGARLDAVNIQIELENRIAAAQAKRDADDRLTAEKAKADAHAYDERVRLQMARERLQLKAETQALELEYSQKLAELDAFKLRETLRVQTDYNDVTIQRMIVEQLPAILEAKGKLLPNLRTYIAGPHDDGPVGLMAGLATFGPDVMAELKNFIAVLSGGETQLESAQRQQISAAGAMPRESGEVLGGTERVDPGHPPTGSGEQ